MTLTNILPSLRSSLPTQLGSGVWPSTASWDGRGDLVVGDVALSGLAARHGTPTYVLDEADVRMRCGEYLDAFGPDGVAYTAKALLTRGVARWLAEEGLRLYAGSVGELHVGLAGGFPPDRIVMYGSAKTPEDLDAAYTNGVGTIVAESLSEITRLAATAPRGQRVLLRILAGHEPLDGTDNHRFGLRVGSGEAAAAVARLAAQPGLALVGFDCSVGHQVNRFAVYEREVRRLVEFLAVMRARHGIAAAELNLGGGHAVAYSSQDLGFALDAFAGRIRAVVNLEADRHHLPAPRLTVSPGRAIVSRAGITVYRVVSVVQGQNGRRIVAVDGGMTDCPAGALCGSRHTAVLFGRTSCAAPQPASLVGRHNDSADVIVPTLDLPADLRPGDFLAVAGTGAYHHSLASNYHLLTRPALLGVRDGHVTTLVRRETLADLLARDGDASA